MQSDREKPAAVSWLAWMLGGVFEIARDGGALRIRALPRRQPRPAPVEGGQVVQLRERGRG